MNLTDSVSSINETLRAIENRRSIRIFTKEEVSDSQVTILLRAANEAPSAHNQQSWRFVVMRNKKSRT